LSHRSPRSHGTRCDPLPVGAARRPHDPSGCLTWHRPSLWASTWRPKPFGSCAPTARARSWRAPARPFRRRTARGPGWSSRTRGRGGRPSSALRRATGALGPQRRRRIVAATVSATSGTVLLADAHGNPLGRALSYSDGRAIAEAARAQEVGHGRWEQLGLRIAPSFGLPKLAWLCARTRRANGPGGAFSTGARG
jgi:hypothetical protein